MKPDNIKPEHIRKYMDKRGAKSRVQANREKTFTRESLGGGMSEENWGVQIKDWGSSLRPALPFFL